MYKCFYYKDCVKVAIRCRPQSQTELKSGCKVVVRMDHLTGQVNIHRSKAGAVDGDQDKIFTFDNVFGMDTKQVDIYNEIARPLVEFVLEGYNGTCHICASHFFWLS